MDIPKRLVPYGNSEYEVCEWAIEDVNKLGLEFDEAYISYLLTNQSPWSSWSLTVLASIDILNRKHIGKGSTLGRVVSIDRNGSIIACFENLFDAVMGTLNSNYTYSFEKVYDCSNLPQKQVYDFFGLKIKVKSFDEWDDIIGNLNKTIRRCKNRYFGKNKIFREMYNEGVSSRMSYDDYVIKGIRWDCFNFGQFLRGLNNVSSESIGRNSDLESKCTQHNIEKCNDYEVRLNNLFERYSIDGTVAFKKMYDLNEVRGRTGIYILCFPQIKGCYVGKTTKCFARRIPQHFTTPNSAFDRKYCPDDVKEIFVLQLYETQFMVDAIESDCIASLGSEICLNAVAGGESIDFIKSERYDSNKYQIDLDLVKWASQDSINIANYLKECRFSQN
ncbi:MAG: GIY-YIG nuclease family protein [Clostridia bacterium]|nr:GIY-YIG nuclease family protein [Clostridia bacterium]